MDPTLLAALRAYLTELLKDIVPNKDITVKLNVEISITTPPKP